MSAARPRTRRGPTFWIGLGGLALVTLVGAAGGAGSAAMCAGFYLLITFIVAAVRGHSWLGRTTRRASSVAIAACAVVALAGASTASPADPSPSASPTTSITASATPTPAEPAPDATVIEVADGDQPISGTENLAAPELPDTVDVAAAAQQATPQTALATALLLTVKGRAPKTGYDRANFGARWADTDRNGCDTRNDILTRDLTAVTYKPGTKDCVVLTGTFADPYSGTTIGFERGEKTSSAVQIDHVIALSDAWQKGAQQWDAATREKFANDPLNLLAADGPLNSQKGDGDTATWLPPNKAFRCVYVARQVGVKYTYGLWVTEAEQNAMVAVLSTCPAEPLPAGSTVPEAPVVVPEPAPVVTTPPPAPAPKPAPVVPAPPVPAPPVEAPPAPAPEAPSDVYYKNCTAARDAGAAPVYRGDPGYGKHLDRDNDGIGCE
ncbi:Excalibur calcium-binding domain-containing protein [Sanguibacter gelidistatuariae]|uniref:Excalibur calcium-binding domain-containing protein n=1 Tax=Sanguibacter gelidistatuariae TaxID=1814289 RepID=A0A1G6GYN6_9MICO|nr:DUF1524 domain-containing protein [Sanguibacter gelidistatuariae]SDB86226.1 Excalibur calcium-binding domain-containing protein [Sanguibacter gelidistatuariae]